MKDYLHFRHCSQFTTKNREQCTNGMNLLMTMEKNGLLMKGDYQALDDALEHIGLKKYHKAIEDVSATYSK